MTSVIRNRASGCRLSFTSGATLAIAAMLVAGRASAQAPLPALPAQPHDPADDRSTAPPGQAQVDTAAPPPPAAPPPSTPAVLPLEGPSGGAPTMPAPAPAPLGSPRAYLDYSDGTFFLRSADDNLVLNTGGRVHFDTYAFAGPSVSDYHRSNGTGLVPNLFFRRFVLESGGLVRKHWFFWIGGNFAPTSIDGSQSTTSTANVYDGFVGYQADPHHQIYVGEYNAPVTMENVTSSRWLDLMERALVVRTVAAPTNKEIGITYWGATREGVAPLEYQLGVFGGDGMNRPNVDNRVDGMARVVFRPLATSRKDVTQRLHIGASSRFGSRDDAYVMYDAPTLSTPGGYAFWSPTYTTADKTEVHVIPSGNQVAAGAELYVPFERFDVKGEFVYVNDQRREAPATDRKTTLRKGSLQGFGGYLQASYWPLGNSRVNGHPAGRYFGVRPPKDRGNEHPFGLQLVARVETMHLSYAGNGRTELLPDSQLSADTTHIRVNAMSLGANYWATKHVRLTAEYSLYSFPGDPPGTPGGATNQAAAPGARATTKDLGASVLHEIGFRVGLAL